MTHIRIAQNEDIPSIGRLSWELGYANTSAQAIAQRIEVILDSDSEKLWVFEDRCRIKGWIHVFTANRVASPRFAEIGGLVVASDCRRKGIGKQLVRHAEGWAQANQMKIRVRSNVTRTAALKFYQKMGFSASKTQNVLENRLKVI